MATTRLSDAWIAIHDQVPSLVSPIILRRVWNDTVTQEIRVPYSILLELMDQLNKPDEIHHIVVKWQPSSPWTPQFGDPVKSVVREEMSEYSGAFEKKIIPT